MSNLSSMPIADYREKYNLTALLETGTEGGFGVSIALRAGFKRIYSCEIVFDLYNESMEKYGDKKEVHLFYGSSLEVLPAMLDLVQEDKVLFWLDAHMTVDEKGLYSKEDRFPLIQELSMILWKRDCKEDAFLIDDIDLYTADFENSEILKLFPNHFYEMHHPTESDKTLMLFPNI